MVDPSVAERRCAQCRSVAEPGDRYCTICGASLAAPVRARRRPGLLPLVALSAVGAFAVALAVAFVVGAPGQPGTPLSSAAAGGSSSGPATAPDERLGEPFGRAVSVRGTACRFSVLDCEMATVPRDHGDPDAGEAVQVRFGVRRGDPDDRIGTLVIATGGPGTSGIELAEWYITTFPDRVLDRYDVVFFEQRGVGRSEPLRCPNADREYPVWAQVLDGTTERALDRATAWVDQCLIEAEGRRREDLDAYSTFQAAADLDAYLDHLGAGKVVIFGESYGTHLALAYAAHRPDRVEALILDAVVDPTLDPVEASAEQADAFSDVLDRVLASCDGDPVCVDDFPPGGATAVWDAVAARLRDGPATIEMPMRDGSVGAVTFDLTDLVDGTSMLLYTEAERAMLLHALAWAGQDDLRPLARLTARVRGLDPETGRPTTSGFRATGASFLAIHCQEWPASNPAAAVERLQAEVERLRGDGARLAELVAHDLACVAGFAGVSDAAALPEMRGDFPMLVLTSTADPATPTAWAESVAGRAADAYVLVTEDSSHGTFGWGFPCPDEVVVDFLVDGDLPEERRTQCDGGYLVDPYRPLPLGGPDEYPDVLDALVEVDRTILEMPDYVYWDGAPQRIGCHHGGWLEMHWDDLDVFTLHDCQLLPGWPMDGTVEVGMDRTVTMSLTVPDGELEYEGGTFRVSVTGTLDGEAIDLSR